ncbi:nSTAND1 domain-containing NTPase [Azohydromonas caseinilytica]|uniref:ATP-binding protein n=1 Tax=Azohydromonas caseinilytica TaxID=2728836 RepID=A0A848F6K4_9BURK|nr:ATP-binding protein [Azohydromonas caseinilytica]NML15012.1 ATP-binding protein [Azohydromonas caseinilytica]
MSAFLPEAAQVDEAGFALSLPPRPYPGLRPFDCSEWPIFFGRERMVDAVVTRLVRRQFIVVHGDSGSGKSSLIRAGVLPRLHQEQGRGGMRWRTCVALPGGGPLDNLARALAALDGSGNDEAQLLALHRALHLGRQAPAALAELLLADDNDYLCILIDQFEELFEVARRADMHAEAELLTELLVAMAEAPPRGLYIALTMRSEFLGACARFKGLAEAVNVHQYLLPPMETSDMLRAIREPALLYGGRIDAALAERLAADAAGIDGLPLVQHALMLLHREHGGDDPGWLLAPQHYPADGLGALLSRHADAVAQEVNAAIPDRPRLVEDLFRALTTITAEGHAVRRRQPLQALADVTATSVATVTQAVDILRADGVSFLTPRPPQPLQPGDFIDIGHEALMRHWSRMADPRDGWLMREFRNGLVWRSLLVQAESFERNPGNVLSEATTEERRRWLQRRNKAWAERYGGGWERVQALMNASVKAAEDRRAGQAQALRKEVEDRQKMERLRRQLGILAVFLVLTTVLGGVALYQRTQALANMARAQSAEAEARMAGTRYLELLEQTRASYAALQASVARLRSAETAGSEADLRYAVEQAASSLDGAAQELRQASTGLAPRVYIHIANERQRAAAEAFRLQLGKLQLGSATVVAPGVQLVEKQQNNGVLRCFRASECRDEAPQLLRLINALLASPKLELQDLSERYDASSRIRPRHYEVWFGNEDVKPASPSAK